MSNNANNAYFGRPAAATTASGSGATQFNSPTPGTSRAPINEAPPARGFNPGQAGPSGRSFNAIPATPASRSSSTGPSRGRSHGRGRNPQRTPQQPNLPKTYNGDGTAVPNSMAEMAAYGKAMAEHVKDLARFNEATEVPKSRNHRGPKRSHWGPSGNGNYNNSFPVVLDESAQHRERARSLQGSQLPSSNKANPTGQAHPNSVAQTLLNEDCLLAANSFNHLEQLDLIRRLTRELHDRRTTDARHVEIALFLRKIVVSEHPEGPPPAKKQALARNGKPTVEVLTLYSSHKEQLPLTKVDFASIMGKAAAFIEGLPKGGTYPEWNWASWCNKHRGQIAVASEDQAALVTALINCLDVPGVGPFHLWRENEVQELTQVKLFLDEGFMQSWTEKMVMGGLFTRNTLKGTYHEYASVITGMRHVVHFKADAELRDSLALHQAGSSTFHLKLGGQDRKAQMPRDPLVVAAEETALLRDRIERALAKAIAASDPDLVLLNEELPPLQQPEQQQQQGNTAVYYSSESNPNSYISSHDPGETEFVRVWKLMEAKREQLKREQAHQQEQQQRLEEHQQAQLLQFGRDRQILQAGVQGSTTPIQQQLREEKGSRAKFSIIKYLINNLDPSLPGVVRNRVASFEDASSPPHGVDLRTLTSGLPPPPTNDSDSDSNVTFELADNNTSTGSATVDNLEVRLAEEDMDDNEAPDS
jgi:hypothetical protein